MDLGPICSRWVQLQIFLVPEVSTQVEFECMDLRPHTPWEASLAIWTKCPEACLSRSCSQEPGHRPSSQGGTNANFGLTRFQTNAPEVLGNNKGSKVTETIFYRKQRVYYNSELGGDNSQSPEPRSVSGAWLNTYRVCPFYPPFTTSPLPLLVCGYNCGKLCRASR
jgi:hypothetical protein